MQGYYLNKLQVLEIPEHHTKFLSLNSRFFVFFKKRNKNVFTMYSMEKHFGHLEHVTREKILFPDPGRKQIK